LRRARTLTDQTLWPLIEAFRVGATADNGVLSIEFEKNGKSESQTAPQQVDVQQGKSN